MSRDGEGREHVEELLRGALSARADQVTQDQLSSAAPPPASGGARWPAALTVIATAAAAVAVGVLVLGGWRPLGGGESTAGAGSSAVSGGAVSGSAVSGSASASPSGSASPLTPVCAPEAVSAFVLPDTPSRAHGGGTNHVGLTIGLTNTGTTPCRMYGYLGVGFYRAGALVSAATTDRGNTYLVTVPGPTSFVLAPGQSGYTDLDWSTADGTLPLAPFDEIRLILPDQKRQLPIAYFGRIGGHAHELRQTALTATPLPIN